MPGNAFPMLGNEYPRRTPKSQTFAIRSYLSAGPFNPLSVFGAPISKKEGLTLSRPELSICPRCIPTRLTATVERLE